MNTVNILFQIDNSCEMESLSVNGKVIGFGNTWDNHCEDRLDAIKKTLTQLNIDYTVTIDKKWKYED